MNRKAMTTLLAMLFAAALLAAPAAYADEDVPTENAIYTLTYPDGSTVTTEDYDEAMALLDEWKLLYSGQTDEDGNIVLEDWASEGTIKIVETEVPEGYTADTTEYETDLADGQIDIINVKEEESSSSSSEAESSSAASSSETEGSSSAKTESVATPAKSSATPKTGDEGTAALLLMLAIASAAAALVARRMLARQ